MTSVYDAFVQTIIVESDALLARMRAKNRFMKQELEVLQRELRSTYLVQRFPGRFSGIEQVSSNVAEAGQGSAAKFIGLPALKNANIETRPISRLTSSRQV